MKVSPYFLNKPKISRLSNPKNVEPSDYKSFTTPQKCSVCEFMDVSPGQSVCSVCTSYKSKKKQQEFNTMEYLLEQEDLKHFSQMNTKISCAPNADRPDFLWVLEDRVIILECDENQHKYASSATCEREREYRIADALRDAGKFVVLIRFNPDQKNVSPWKMYDVLGKTIRECFHSEDCIHAEDGITRKYLGYDRTRIRSIEKEYSVSQRGMLQENLLNRSTNHCDEEWVRELLSLLKHKDIEMTPQKCLEKILKNQ